MVAKGKETESAAGVASNVFSGISPLSAAHIAEAEAAAHGRAPVGAARGSFSNPYAGTERVAIALDDLG